MFGKGRMHMYRKALSFLVLGSFLFMACFWCVKGMDTVRLSSEPVMLLKLELWELEEKAKAMAAQEETGMKQDSGSKEKGLGIVDVAVSGQRIVGYSVMELAPFTICRTRSWRRCFGSWRRRPGTRTRTGSCWWPMWC